MEEVGRYLLREKVKEKRMRDEWGREQVTSLPVLLSG